MLWVPLPDSVTLVLHEPPLPTVTVASAVVPLSNSVTVVPASPVPEIGCAAWLVVPPGLVIATAGATVSTVAVTADVVVTLPAASVALAVKLWLPSFSAAVVKLQPPSPSSVATPRSVAPSNTCTDDRLASLTVPDSASVLSLVTPPLEIVGLAPVFVPIVLLIVSLGLVVSTVAVTAAVVVLLPAVSVALAVMLWLPSVSGPVVKLQLPPLIVAAPRSVAPSNTCTDNRLASLTISNNASVL